MQKKEAIFNEMEKIEHTIDTLKKHPGASGVENMHIFTWCSMTKSLKKMGFSERMCIAIVEML
mgnify:CR=1 FL=1